MGTSILQHANLPGDPEVGVLRRQGDIWDWDEHRDRYELAAARATTLFRDIHAPGLKDALARGLFSVATSADEDHFSIRAVDDGTEVYTWPTVPSATHSKDIVLIGAFLGAARAGESLLEPHDIPLAVERAFLIRHNVPVLMLMITDDGLAARRFELRAAFYRQLLSRQTVPDASERDVRVSRPVALLPPHGLTARFKEVFQATGFRPSHPLLAALRRGIRRLRSVPTVPKPPQS